MYKVRYIATGEVFDLEGFNGDKIIIRFNNDQSVGTVPKTGYILLGKDKSMTFEKLQSQFEKEIKNVL